MHSSKLEQYFTTDCNKTNLKDSLEGMLCLIDPKYAQDFENYRNSILNTLENWSQI